MKSVLKSATIILLAGAMWPISCKKEYSCEKCREVNMPPIANAGNDSILILPADSVLLDGSNSSDPDDGIVSYSWKKIAGPDTFKISNVTSVKTMVNKLVKAIYHFELTVKDKGGLSAKDTVSVSVGPVAFINRPPVVNAGNDTSILLPANTANLDGSGSTDPDNNIANYTWTKISGPSLCSITNANAMQTQVTNLVLGVYQFELKVTDSGGFLSKDTMIVFVDTAIQSGQADYEIIITLPIDSAFIDDYYRDTDGTCVVKISGPNSGIIAGSWIKNLVQGEYYFRRYAMNCNRSSETIKVTVLDTPNEKNTITYKNLIWEYNYAFSTNYSPHLFFSRPGWPGNINHSLEVYLQTDSINNGKWFPVPSNTGGYIFWLDCQFSNYACLASFIVKVSPENKSWDGKKANLKMKIL